MLSAPPAPRIPPPRLPPRTPHLCCAVMSAPPDGFFPPSDEDTSENDGDEGEDQDNVSVNTAHSFPECEQQAYSTHSTPQHSSATSGRMDEEHIPRRLTHPEKRPSHMRAAMPERSSPVAIRASPQSMRKKLYSPQQNIRKQKQSSDMHPHMIPTVLIDSMKKTTL